MGSKRKGKANYETIDEYLAALSNDKRVALERLRKIIRAAAPRAEECISYQLPAFRLDGKGLVWFGAAANHCAIYGVLGADKGDLKDYDTSKGTIRFQAANPLPATLVRKLVKARIARNAGPQLHAAAGGSRERPESSAPTTERPPLRSPPRASRRAARSRARHPSQLAAGERGDYRRHRR